MRKALAQIANQTEVTNAFKWEAAQTLMCNHERVVDDITNPGPKNIDGKMLTQTDLKRVDSTHRALVSTMVREVCCSLVGKPMSKRLTPEEMLVWAEAARYLSGRIQGTSGEMPGRTPDMSSDAAKVLRTTLAQMEAAHQLMSNHERVVLDITNTQSTNIDGKKLTQTDLKRLDTKHRASVDSMIREVCCRLLGKTASAAQAPEEKLVWADAARYLSGRIQGTPGQMPGRKPDMSSDAATALRTVLGGL